MFARDQEARGYALTIASLRLSTRQAFSADQHLCSISAQRRTIVL